MNEFQEKLNECKECPFEEYDINWYDENTGCGKLGAYWDEGSTKKIMIVGQNPSHKRWKGTHSLQGTQGDEFRKIFGKENLVYTNFIQVSTPDNRVDYFSEEQIKHCFKHLMYEIEKIKPEMIIFCSKFAERKIKEYGLCERLKQTKIWIYFIHHPDYYFKYGRGTKEEYINKIIEIKSEAQYLQIL
ncbi:MAG: uracil-DNA glycosylase family protein [Candidatus Pacearchaeota archaeon]